MFQARFHGRGGQGVVTAAELLSVAAFDQGLHSQALPSFGSERTGAPVIAYCRIDDRPIRAHDPVTTPDVVVVQDPTMLHLPGVLDDIADDGVVIVNSSRTPSELGLDVAGAPRGHRARDRPRPPAAGPPAAQHLPLGALAGLTGIVDLSALQVAMLERFEGDSGDRNALLAADGFQMGSESPEGARRAQAG